MGSHKNLMSPPASSTRKDPNFAQAPAGALPLPTGHPPAAGIACDPSRTRLQTIVEDPKSDKWDFKINIHMYVYM